jgi:hypothetical protein
VDRVTPRPHRQGDNRSSSYAGTASYSSARAKHSSARVLKSMTPVAA